MTAREHLQAALAAVRRHPVEVSVHLLIWGGFNALMIAGDTNGVGYFHQPGHSLVFPMLHGSAWNAAAFLASGLALLRRLFERRWRPAAATFLVLSVAVLAGKTAGEWLYIRAFVPDLRAVSPLALSVENAYSLAAAVILGQLYFLVRRGVVIGATRRGAAITVQSGTSRHRIEIDAIRYLKAESNYVAFHFGQRPLLALMTMGSALERLPAGRFLRIHRSYAVNLGQVTGLATDAVLVASERLPIGRSYLKAARRRVRRQLGAASPS